MGLIGARLEYSVRGVGGPLIAYWHGELSRGGDVVSGKLLGYDEDAITLQAGRR